MWFGRGAAEFGLESGSIVEKTHLERLCEGFDPYEPTKRLVWNAGRKDGHAPRSPGTDITLSVPKSLSILWACSDEVTQAQIERVVLNAARQTLAYLEDYCGLARVGKGGLGHEKVPLLFALFPQSSSRLNDMQLHIHCILVNATRHADGRTTAVDPTYLYGHQFAGGAIFNVAVSEGLRRELGIETVRRRTGSFLNFEVAGIPEEAIEHYSKRRSEIDELLADKGLSRETSAAEFRETLCLESRRGKEELPRSVLIEQWRKEAESLFGITPKSLRSLHGRVSELPRWQKGGAREQAFLEGLAELEEQHSHWDLATLHQKIAEHAQGQGVSVADVREVIASKLDSPELEVLGELMTQERTIDLDPGHDWRPRHYVDRYETRITSPAICRAEAALSVAVERLLLAGSLDVSETAEAVIEGRTTIAPEQAEAVRYLTSGPNIRLLTGDAGTGKSYTLGACREVWQALGYSVIGCAVAGKAAKELQREAGIASGTLKSLLFRLEHGLVELSAGHVVVVDEAAIVGTRMMQRLLMHCAEAGARCVLVGDAKQVQSIEAGGAFRSLSERLGEARLKEIRRQQEVWRRQAVSDLGDGNARKALKAYLERGQLHVARPRAESLDGVVARWVEDRGVCGPERVLMLASLNAEVASLNKKAQAARKEAGLLGEEKLAIADSLHVHQNDRIRFCQKTRKFGGIENGWSGTVLRVDQHRNTLTVLLDVGHAVTVTLGEYRADRIKLCYASTVFSSQGTTVDVAHVLLGGPLTDKHTALVAASRCRTSCHLFIDAANAGPGLKSAVRQLSKDRTKTLARDVAEEARPITQDIQSDRMQAQGMALRR